MVEKSNTIIGVMTGTTRAVHRRYSTVDRWWPLSPAPGARIPATAVRQITTTADRGREKQIRFTSNVMAWLSINP